MSDDVDELRREVQEAEERIAELNAALESLGQDAERLDHCDTMIDLEPGFYVLRFPVTESCTIRQAIDAHRA